MKLRGIIASALALALTTSLAFAQTNPGSSPLTIAKGGTAASTASGARTSLGVPTGTSGHALGFLDTANTWTGLQTYSATGIAFSVLSSGATANAYSNWQNGTRQWIVGVDADSACASGSATAFIFYDQTATACRGWLSTDGGWIFGSSTTSPGAGNINLTGGAVWNNGTAPTGTGAYVRATSPALVTPALGTPSAAVLTNATGLPVSTGISGLATGIASWLATSSSANLATAVTDETGSGSLVFATSPTLVTPVLGVASATSINKLTITSPASSATLTVPDGVTLTGPASSGTAMTLGNTETVTGVKTFGSSGAVGRLKIAGTTSGSTVLDATAVASGTLTLPAATDTLVGKATTDTLTNKTISGGSNTLSSIANSSLSNMAAYTVKGNSTGSSAAPTDISIPALTQKASPVAADKIMIADSAASDALKYATVSSIASAGSVASYNGRTGAVTATGVDVPLRGYLSGLTLSTAGSSATFGIAIGVATDSTSVSMMSLGSAYTKTTSAWALGTAAGSLDTGAIASSTWYHAFLIQRPDTGVVDVLISLSATAPTMPTNYTLFRRIGSMKTNGSAQWTAFTQLGDEFLWSSPPLDQNTVSVPNGSASLLTFSTPTGIQTNVLIEGYGTCTAIAQAYASSPDQTDITTPNGTTIIVPSAGGFGALHANIRTNTSSQIRWRANAASFTINASTRGWIDRRGRDS